MNFESENLEFKSRITDEIYKEVIAFANTDGGVIYAGIDDDGNIVGLENVDEELVRITNGIRDAILPDVTMFVRFTVQDNKVVRITVNEGTNKPYYLRSKGLKPSGVYIRRGSSSIPASSEQIRNMIKQSDGDNFEEMRSSEQELTFEAAAAAFNRYHVEFGAEKYRALGLTQKNSSVFTNLACLISDQCGHTTKVAVFSDEDNTSFLDSKEFEGSVFRQLDDTYSYLMLCNKRKVSFKGLERIEIPDYPDEAVREALLNSIVHRDYGFSGSIIININSREMEFISIGGLLPGLSAEDIRAGISQPRNKNLAEIFHRLRLIESYGTGIRRIYKLYESCVEQPRIEVTSNTFRLILPNMNAVPKFKVETQNTSLNPQMEKILDYIKRNGSITDEETGKLIEVKRTRIYVITKEMRDLGLIESVGRGPAKKYVLKKQ